MQSPICRECFQRPSGCWKSLDYGCERKYWAAAELAMNTRACPLGKLALHAPGCLYCGWSDPLAGPEIRDPFSAAQKERHIAALHDLAIPPVPDVHGSGVVLCGAGRYWLGNCIAVKMLRRTGYRGPIQIWADGPHDDTLAGDGVEVVDMAAFRQRHPARILRGWENKTYALLHSGFERVAYLDADAYPVAGIQHWLDSVVTFSYWRNFDVTWGNTKWEWYGDMAIPGNQHPPVQGGQLFVHVSNAWRELWIANWINQHSDYFYSHQYGDECSWRVAFALTGARNHLLGLAAWNGVGCTCSGAIVHRYYAKLMSNSVPRWCPWLDREGEIRELYDELTRGDTTSPAARRRKRERMLGR